MKYCDKCGTSLKDDNSYCTKCGADFNTKESDSLHILDADYSDPVENTIENIEKRVAKYYNDTYLSAGKSGKYFVLHHETTVSGEACNVIVRYQDNKDSDNSSVSISVADVSVNIITGDCTVHSKPPKKTVKRTGSHVFICIIAVLVMLNIVCIPFLCNKYWSIGNKDINQDAQSFSDMIEDLSDGYSSNDDVPIDGLYYFGGLACALFVFISALGKSSGACTFGSLAGIGLLLYLFYQIYLGTTRWYVGLHDAQLTFGYYISCGGFISILIASLYKKQE